MISEALGEAFVQIRADFTTFKTDLDKGRTDVEKQLKPIGEKSTALGKSLSIGLTAPIVAIGAALGAVGLQFDGAVKTIRAGTGATGKDLEALGESFRKVWATGAEGSDVVSQALADINTRTGASGPLLEDLTRQYLNFADVAKTDVAPLIAQATGLFNSWGISVENSGAGLDHLWKVSQSTGIAVSDLINQSEKFGPILRELGFSFEESAVLLGEWDRQGINVRKVMGGLQAAAVSFAADNIPLKEGLAATVAEIERLGPGAASSQVALDTFGASGLIMRDAILSGALSIGDLTAAIAGSSETINKADAETEDFAEKFGTLKNQASAALAPIGIQLVKALEDLMPLLTAGIGFLADMATWFSNLPAPVQTTVLVIGGLVAAIGPALIVFGQLVSAVIAVGPAVTALIAGFKLILPFLGPAGWIVAGVAAVFLIWQNWDKISAIAQAVYTGVKTWLVDRFQAVIDSIKAKVQAVTGFFGSMYDKVVGNSFVPDMINGIAAQFARLDSVMVAPTGQATNGISGLFGSLKSMVMGQGGSLMTGLSGLFSGQLGSILGGGADGALGHVQGFATKAVSSLIGMIPVVGPWLTNFAGPIMSGLKKIGSAIAGFFGGPSGAEKEGREVAGGFRKGLMEGLSSEQMKEVNEAAQGAWKGNEIGAATVIAIRDAYIAAGHSAEEALEVVDRLWKAEKEGGDAVNRVIREIEGNMRGPLTGAAIQAGQAGQVAFGSWSNAAGQAFRTISIGMDGIQREFKEVFDEMGQPILIPIEFEIGDIPNLPQVVRGGGGGGGGSSSGGGGGGGSSAPPPETPENRNERQAASRAAIERWMSGNEERQREAAQFFSSNPDDFDRFARSKGISFAQGGMVMPGAEVAAMLHGGMKGEVITPLPDLERLLSMDRGGGQVFNNEVNFNLSTPLATIDTVRQLVYDEIGPLFLQWLEGNKSGSRTKAQQILGMT